MPGDGSEATTESAYESAEGASDATLAGASDDADAMAGDIHNVIDTAHAHVWASLDGGSWMYLGNWHPPDAGTCAEPDATQTPDAEANIGQDYWKICILQ